MVEVDVTIVIRQRKTFPKELPCSWPPYSSGFNTEWDKFNATRHETPTLSQTTLHADAAPLARHLGVAWHIHRQAPG